MDKKLTGAVLATAVAGLFLSGQILAEETAGGAKEPEKVCCKGANSCKGQGACGGADNACAWKNGCSGKGWIKASKDDCKAKGGTEVECPAKH